MTRSTVLFILLFATLALVAAILTVVAIVPGSNVGFESPATALTFIGGAAVGIERVIETLWTFLGGVLGSYWPLNAINKEVKALTDELDNSLQPFHEQAIARIDELKKGSQLTVDQLKKLEDAPIDIKRLKDRFDEIKTLAPGNQRVQLLTAAAAQNVSFLKEKYGDILGELEDAATIANSAIDGIQNFIATFKDNPGRRLISIYLGAILGLIVAGTFGLDVLLATGVKTDHRLLSVIATGLLIGLGANPTHEVIRLIQEHKEGQKGANAKQPDLP